jgi:hypothetical protein
MQRVSLEKQWMDLQESLFFYHFVPESDRILSLSLILDGYTRVPKRKSIRDSAHLIHFHDPCPDNRGGRERKLIRAVADID